MLTFALVVVGNLLAIILFAMRKVIRKKSLFLVMNMTFAEIMLGSVSLPIFIYDIGVYFQLWTSRTGGLWSNKPFFIFYMIIDTVFSQGSLISAFISCERFYAIYWPFKHRTLSMRPHCYFYSVDTTSVYFRDMDAIKSLIFAQTYYVIPYSRARSSVPP